MRHKNPKILNITSFILIVQLVVHVPMYYQSLTEQVRSPEDACPYM